MDQRSPLQQIAGIVVGAVVVLLLTHCARQPEPPPQPPPPQRVENPTLGVAIATLPAFFKVANNQGEVLELVPADPAGTGKLSITVGPREQNINLVAAWQRHQTEIQGRPGGEYKGQRELVTPLGTTFYSRGRFQEGSTLMEETVIFAIHPGKDRPLQLTYRYPAGDDTQQRIEGQLFAVLGELEGLGSTQQ